MNRTFEKSIFFSVLIFLHPSIKQLIQEPSVQLIRSSFLDIFHLIIMAVSKLPRIVQRLDVQPTEKLSAFSDLISKDSECLDWQLKIEKELKLNEQNMELYQKRWLQYAYLWQLDKPETIERFAISELATANGFNEKVIEHRTLSHRITLIDSTMKVHFMLVNATEIRKKIRIEIEEWKRLYLDALHRKTNEKLVEWLKYIDENSEQILKQPKSVEELQKCCTTYEQLTSEIDRYKCTLTALNGQFDILYKYGVSIDGSLNELRLTMRPRWQEYLSKLNDANEMLKNATGQLQTNIGK